MAVVTACVGAFLFRAGCILYLVCTDQTLAVDRDDAAKVVVVDLWNLGE